MTTTTEIRSVLPEDLLRERSVRTVARLLARAVDRTRMTPGLTPEAAVAAVVEEHRIELPSGIDAAVLADRIMTRIMQDTIYDSEYEQALRATLDVLEPFGDTLWATGWIAGEVVRHTNDRFELTGRACERCGVNPEAYGHGGGTRCLDVRGCRWWECM